MTKEHIFPISMMTLFAAFCIFVLFKSPRSCLYEPELEIVQSYGKLKHLPDSALLTTIYADGFTQRQIATFKKPSMEPGMYGEYIFYVKEITDSVKIANYQLAEKLK